MKILFFILFFWGVCFPSYIGRVIIHDGDSTVDIETYDGHNSLATTVIDRESFSTFFLAENQSGTVGYMLIDLSDVTNWKHTLTSEIHLKMVVVNVNTSTSPAFVGKLEFGFLSNVDATDGDLNKIGVLSGQRGAAITSGSYSFIDIGFCLSDENWFGAVTANDVTWQNDVNLYGPDGATSYPAGTGDFVMKLTSSAGSIDISVTVIYTTD